MPELAGGMRLEKSILNLKVGKKYDICDKIIFGLVQFDICQCKQIGNILDIFPYEFIAESLAKLHNNGLVFINMNTGEIQLTSKIQEIVNIYNEEEQRMPLKKRDSVLDNFCQIMDNFNGIQRVVL